MEYFSYSEPLGETKEITAIGSIPGVNVGSVWRALCSIDPYSSTVNVFRHILAKVAQERSRLPAISGINWDSVCAGISSATRYCSDLEIVSISTLLDVLHESLKSGTKLIDDSIYGVICAALAKKIQILRKDPLSYCFPLSVEEIEALKQTLEIKDTKHTPLIDNKTYQRVCLALTMRVCTYYFCSPTLSETIFCQV